MQFRDLKTQYRKLKDRIDEAIIRVSTDCNFIMGKQVTELEKKLAGYAGTDHSMTSSEFRLCFLKRYDDTKIAATIPVAMSIPYHLMSIPKIVKVCCR